VAHGAGPVVHGDLAGGYAMSERVGKCAMAPAQYEVNCSSPACGTLLGVVFGQEPHSGRSAQ